MRGGRRTLILAILNKFLNPGGGGNPRQAGVLYAHAVNDRAAWLRHRPDRCRPDPGMPGWLRDLSKLLGTGHVGPPAWPFLYRRLNSGMNYNKNAIAKRKRHNKNHF
ncbi:hypothetical protein AZA_13839 [Nitrospirillum viridazoti Y2]|nr:hypothetical protein AZA_13839 [Nitrospirillum amazonense Y2]